ncbi:MAG: nucleotide-binding protein [Chloroflexota bacterium]|nr:nucleotide-binding protein [Chloroflexota bacterium]
MSGIFKELTDESFEIEQMGDALFMRGKGRVTKAQVAPLAAKYQQWVRKLRPVERTLGFLEKVGGGSDYGAFRFLSNPSRLDYDSSFRASLRGQRRLILKAEDKAAGLNVALPTRQLPPGPPVFVVHGRNDRYLRDTTVTLRQLGLTPTVLRDQPNQGRTIIEKIEDHSDMHAAVVLLTGDDVGGLRGDDGTELSLRARQNVIFELGFFTGILGRGKVCALLERGVEKPSDYQGVLYLPLDEAGRWKIDLGREMRAAGLPVLLSNLC